VFVLFTMVVTGMAVRIHHCMLLRKLAGNLFYLRRILRVIPLTAGGRCKHDCHRRYDHCL
jgi:hypothetical protein